MFGSISGFVGDAERVGWGEECEKVRSRSTGGLCQFKVSNLLGVFEFALRVEGEMRSRSAKSGFFSADGNVDVSEGIDQAWENSDWDFNKGTKKQDLHVQLVATDSDSAVSNTRLHNA